MRVALLLLRSPLVCAVGSLSRERLVSSVSTRIILEKSRRAGQTEFSDTASKQQTGGILGQICVYRTPRYY